MTTRNVQFIAPLIAYLALTGLVPAEATGPPHAQRQPAKKRMVPARALPCGDLLAFQVLLDRQGFSPGEIDGQPGINFSHALAALQDARKLPQTGQPDCDTWKALDGDAGERVIAIYTVTEDDVRG